jgi:hypothetical protein
LGALDPARLEKIRGRWMLPSSHLILFESPMDAARRIAREQLEMESIPMKGPAVFSEAYAREAEGPLDPHWDLHFVFEAEWPRGRPLRAAAWSELAFLDTGSTNPKQIARGHGDIVRLPRG